MGCLGKFTIHAGFGKRKVACQFARTADRY
jgi:hypothetical protein